MVSIELACPRKPKTKISVHLLDSSNEDRIVVHRSKSPASNLTRDDWT